MEKESANPVYARPVMEFLATATEYCALLEQCKGRNRADLVHDLMRLLPVLYWRALVLHPLETEGQFLPDDKVTEDDYNYVRDCAREVMQDWDEYEDLVRDDATGRDECQWRSVAETMADVYQPLRNFVWVYQQRLEQCMPDALWAVHDSFELYWGQDALDILRHLHRMKHMTDEESNEDDI